MRLLVISERQTVNVCVNASPHDDDDERVRTRKNGFEKENGYDNYIIH